MVQINFAQKTVNVKIVYYGPGMSGKTTNLEVVHQRAPESNRGELTSISTDGDRTLFFDYMPLDLGTVAGMRTCFQCYTVPGQVYYNSTRKLVLQGVDGVIFIADSSASMLDQNIESLRNLEENLNEYGKSLSTLPHVLQWNKRDLPDAMSVEELDRHMNHHKVPAFEAIANTGQGVFPTLKALAAAVLKNIMQESGGSKQLSGGAAPAPPQQAPAPARPAQHPHPAHQPAQAHPAPQPGHQLDVAHPQAPVSAGVGGGEFGNPYGAPPMAAQAPAAPYGVGTPGQAAPMSAPQRPQVGRPAAGTAAMPPRPGSAGELMQPPRKAAAPARPRSRTRPQAAAGSAARRVRAQVAHAPVQHKKKKSFPMGVFAVVAAGVGAAIAWAVLTYLKQG